MPVRKKTDDAPRPVVWDFYRDGVTQGLIDSFLTCRHQTFLRYVCGWSPRDMSGAIEFGSAFHDMAEHVSMGKAKTVADAAAIYIARRRKELPANIADVEMLTAQAQAVCEHYFTHWTKHDTTYQFLGREQTFRVPYQAAFGQTWLRGRFDGVISSRKGKGQAAWGLFETKTKGKIDEEGIEETLQFDIQTNLYLYALEKMMDDTRLQKCNGPPSIVLYDVIRQPQLRQGANESLADFCARIRTDVPVRPEFYFHRWNETVRAGRVKTWEVQFLRKMIREIEAWFLEVTIAVGNHRFPILDCMNFPRHFLNPKALIGLYGGRKSDYFGAICRNDYSRLYRREVAFPELEER